MCVIVSEVGPECGPKNLISIGSNDKLESPFFQKSTPSCPQCFLFNFIINGSVVYFCLDCATEK